MFQDLKTLLNSWNIIVKNESLFSEAFEHASFKNERRVFSSVESSSSNERLEFLGDSVLGLIIAEELMIKCPNSPEGELSRLKSIFVSEKSLAERARSLGLGPYLKMSRGELQQGGQNRDSSLADLVEALLAAIYLDQGYEVTRNFCRMKLFSELSTEQVIWNDIEKSLLKKDCKSLLQEIFQQKGWGTPRYLSLNEGQSSTQGPFIMGLYLGEYELDRLEASSKKEATQLLAQRMLANGPQKIVESLKIKGFMTSGSDSNPEN